MAQRTEKEADVPETLTPCIINNNNNMSISTNNNRFANDPISSSSSISEPDSFGIEARTTSQEGMTKRESFVERKSTTETESEMKPAATNRCSGCRKKVGLTGFRCRCGDVFCSVHRYSDRHACSYDYKAAGKAAIARENPVVKSAQIVRI